MFTAGWSSLNKAFKNPRTIYSLIQPTGLDPNEPGKKKPAGLPTSRHKNQWLACKANEPSQAASVTLLRAEL